MTFEEGLQLLTDNRKFLDTYSIRSTKPAHQVVCSFVSASNQSLYFHEAMFEAIHERHLDNKEQLTFLGLLNEPMFPVVVVLIQGRNNIMALSDFLSFLSEQAKIPNEQ